jgi:hypothetical protein
MTRWCAGDGVLMRLARLGASVEHNGQRGDSESEDGCDRRSRRPEHIPILPHGDVRPLSWDRLGHRARPAGRSRRPRLWIREAER